MLDEIVNVWVVRTPYTDPNLTYGLAMNYFFRRAKEMGIDMVWRKGRGKSKDNATRYHYWEIDNEQDAIAFHLAYGDQIVEHRSARRKEDE